MSDLWFNYDVAAAKSAASNAAMTSSEKSSNLDKDAFLQLMITQMQYQDPLNPMDNSQMLAQMAQFSALEQMQNVSKSTLQSMAFSMIGKTVEGTMENSSGGSDAIMGVVSSVLVQNGKTYLEIGDKILSVDKVTNVYTDPITSINSNLANNQSFNLIGKVVQAITLGEDFSPSGFVEGMVDYVKFSGNGGTILVIGDKEVYPSEVVSVGTEKMLIGKMVGIEEKNEDGDYEVVEYPVTEVIIRDEEAYVKVGGKEIKVEKINFVTDALALKDKEVTLAGVSGTVSGIIIRDGVPYLRVGDAEISYKAYKNIPE